MGASKESLLGDRLEHWAQVIPNSEALRFGSRCYSWSELRDRIHRLSGALVATGIGRGDVVAFLDRNHSACLELTLAAGALGAATAVVNWRYADDEMRYVLRDCGARVVLVGSDSVADLAKLRGELPALELVVAVGPSGDEPADEYERFLASARPVPPQADVRGDDSVVILYSSGTTGRPKGVMMSHRALILQTRNLHRDIRFSAGDRSLAVLPQFHVAGLGYQLLGLDNGVPTTITRDAHASSIIKAIGQGGTHACLVPTIIAELLNQNATTMTVLRRLKMLAYGAAPMPWPLLRGALEALPATDFVQIYGMTEVCGAICTLSPAAHRDEAHPERLESAGTMLPGAELRVVEPDTGRDVAPGQTGEFWIRSAQSMTGYLNDPEQSAAAVVDGGWLRTGDAGRLDDGFVYVEDRIKDMIITGGENVYSGEIERILIEHSAVDEVAVIGVPDDHWGEAVKAFVVPKLNTKVSAEELTEFCRTRLAGFKVPRIVDLVSHLPRNLAGKVLKRELRQP